MYLLLQCARNENVYRFPKTEQSSTNANRRRTRGTKAKTFHELIRSERARFTANG